jgi:hypothetical protein
MEVTFLVAASGGARNGGRGVLSMWHAEKFDIWQAKHTKLFAGNQPKFTKKI